MCIRDRQCRYYEVDNIFEYMVDTYINGNITSFKDIYRELNKKAVAATKSMMTYWM